MSDTPVPKKPQAHEYVIVTLIVIAIVIRLISSEWGSAESARMTQCRNNVKQWLLAFYDYHDAYGNFPSAFVPAADGTPQHSWRMLVQPYMDSSSFYNEYRFEESWNSAANRALADRFHSSSLDCPSQEHTPQQRTSNYVVVTGPETAFPDGKAVSLADITDGPENTILIVEIVNSDIFWTEPRDLQIDEMSFTINDPSRPSVSSVHPRGVTVGFADGEVYRLDPSLRPETLQALLTIAGGGADPARRPDPG